MMAEFSVAPTASSRMSVRHNSRLLILLGIASLAIIFGVGGNASAITGSDSWSGAVQVCTSPQLSTTNNCSFTATVPVNYTIESGESWNNSAYYKFTPASSATVYIRAESPGYDNTLYLRNSSGTILSQVDDVYNRDAAISYSLVAGATYYLGVGAYSDIDIPSVSILLTMSRPDAPTGVAGTATGSNGVVNVSWTSSDISTRSITSFRVYVYSGGSQITYTDVVGSPPSTNTTISGLTNGTAYTFTVTASNSVGTSNESVASSAVTPYSTQTVTFGALSSRTYGDTPFTVSASTNAPGATISYSSSTTTVCTTSSNTITIVGNGTCTITATGSAVTGWSSGSATQSFSVAQKAISVTGLSAVNRQYNGTTSVSIAGTGSLVGVLSADISNVVLTGTPTGTASNKNVGTTSVSVGGLSLTGTSSSRYFLSALSVNVTISAKPLTISAPTVSSRQYNGSTSIAATAGTVSGYVGSETLVVTAAGSLNSANAGSRTAVVAYTLANGTNGGLASNYTLSSDAIDVSITPKTLSISGTTVTSRQYDGTTDVAVSPGTVTGFIGSETVRVSALGTISDPNVGTQSTSIVYSLEDGTNGGLAMNYTLSSANINVSITRRNLTISGTTTTPRQYNGSTSVTATPGVLSGLVGQETLFVTATGTLDSPHAGLRTATVAYTLSDGSHGGLASNYALASTTVATTVELRELAITDPLVTSRVYSGSKNVVVTPGTLSGLVGTETVIVAASGVADSANAGTWPVTVTYSLANGLNGGIGSNYTLAPEISSVVISRKALSISGTSVTSREYNGSTSVVATPGTLSGLVGTETLEVTGVGVLDSPHVGSRTATISYVLADGINNGLADNYTLGSSTVSTSVTPRVLAISGTSVARRQYDGTTSVVVTPGMVSGYVGSESLEITATGLVQSKDAGVRAVTVAYSLANGPNGGLASDYYLASHAVSTVIDPKELSITSPTAVGRQYNGTVSVEVKSGTLSGFIGAETVTVSALGEATSANVGTRLVTVSYTLEDGANGGVASNYHVQSGTASVEITPRVLVVSGTQVSGKQYDKSDLAVVTVGAVGNYIGAERPVITASGRFLEVTPGLQAVEVTYSVSNHETSSALGSNYVLPSETLSANIAKAVISFTVTARDRAYNGGVDATLVVGSIFGRISGDNVEIDESKISGTFSDDEPGLNKLVTLSIATGLLRGTDAGKYTYNSPINPRADITQAMQTGFEFTNDAAMTVKSTLNLTTSGGESSGAVSFDVVSGDCVLAGSRLTSERGGISCVVSATKAGDSRYLAVTKNLTVRVDKLTQNLVFKSQPPTAPTVGTTYTVVVESDAFLAPIIAIANSSSSVCSISADVVTFNSVGNCTISASQSGSSVYTSAASSQSVTVVVNPPSTTLAPASSTGQVTRTNGDSASNTGTVATTTSSTTTTTMPQGPGNPNLSSSGSLPELKAGEVTAYVRGEATKVVVVAENGQMVLKIGRGITLSLGSTDPSADSAQVNSDGVLVAYKSKTIKIKMQGLVPGATYTVFMFSEPFELARGVADANGEINQLVTVPKELNGSNHTLQVNGVGPDNEVVSVSMGVKVLSRDNNTAEAVLAIAAAILLALLGGRPILKRRRSVLR